ncbi:MAG: hypothetical protein RIB69_01480 [Roseovarius sp.]
MLAAPAGAEVLSNTNPSIRNNLCVGLDCDVSESFNGNFNQLEIKANSTRLVFEDTSSSSGFPTVDWAIQANDRFTSGEDQLMFVDLGTGAEILTIKSGAPTSTMVLDDTGRVSLGTELPLADLHVVSNDTAKIRLEETISGADWEVSVGNTGIGFYERNATSFPFFVENNAPNGAFWIEDTGNVGVGTSNPAAPLHVVDSASFSFFRITATGAATNDSVDVVFTEGPLGTGQLRYNIVDGDNQEMSLDASGNMILAGTLTTHGPACDAGCDRVFTERQIIPAKDYAARMWADGHLPHVGPTGPNAPFNMTEKMGGMLNALEHAHIYIEDLHQQNAAQGAQIAQMKADHDRQIAALTAMVEDLARKVAVD